MCAPPNWCPYHTYFFLSWPHTFLLFSYFTPKLQLLEDSHWYFLNLQLKLTFFSWKNSNWFWFAWGIINYSMNGCCFFKRCSSLKNRIWYILRERFLDPPPSYQFCTWILYGRHGYNWPCGRSALPSSPESVLT